jgi:hypothetical protein
MEKEKEKEKEKTPLPLREGLGEGWVHPRAIG